MSRKTKLFIAGITLVLLIGVFILFIFSLLGHTELEDLYLHDDLFP